MQEVHLNSLKLHDLADDTNPYHIEPPIDGLSFASIRLGSSIRAGEDGIRINSSFLGERRIMLRGKLTDVGTSAQHIANRQALVAAMAPTRDSNGIIELKTLRLKDLNGSEYRILGEVLPSSLPVDNPRHSSFVIDFLAHSPYIESFNQSTLEVTPLVRGGFVFPVIFPIVFDEGSGGSGTATNNGDAPAKPIITLDGPLTNPRITNNETAEHTALNFSLSDGQQIVIDMAEKTIVQGGVTNRMSKLSSGGFWALASGNNAINLTTGNASDTGKAIFRWRDSYYGI